MSPAELAYVRRYYAAGQARKAMLARAYATPHRRPPVRRLPILSRPPPPSVAIPTLPRPRPLATPPASAPPPPPLAVQIAQNPVVDLGLNAAGAIVGDPALGQQVAALAPLVNAIAPAIGSVVSSVGGAVGSVVDSLFGGDDITPAQTAAQLAYAAAQPAAAGPRTAPRGVQAV